MGCKKICDGDCDRCHNRSFASVEYSRNLTNITINPRTFSKWCLDTYEFKCPNCSHTFDSRIIEISNGKTCGYCSIPLRLTSKLCKENDCDNCRKRSFAMHPMALKWSKNNTSAPRDEFLKSNYSFLFVCDCEHEFSGVLCDMLVDNKNCPYCGRKKLCENDECKQCFHNSFASHSKSFWWSKKNILTPRQVFKRSHESRYFDCHKCFHDFCARIGSLDTDDANCPYCARKVLCEIPHCGPCYNKSFESHRKSVYWSERNELSPRQVFKSTQDKYYLFCVDCKNEFKMRLSDISSRGRWCNICVYKTETLLFNFLRDLLGRDCVEPQYAVRIDGRIHRFDFLLPKHNIFIELDGEQHFRQVSKWKPPELTLKRDIKKINYAVENNYIIVHLLQLDVFNNLNNWKNKLTELILMREYDEGIVIILNNSKNIYEKHIKKIKYNSCKIEIIEEDPCNIEQFN